MMVAIGRFFFQHRNALFPLASLMVLLPGPRILADPLVAVVAGFVIAGLGQLIRVLTIGLRYIIRGGRNRRVYAEDLVTTGLYAHCRNPMYVGNWLILSGVALASNSWGCLAVVIPLFALIYASIVAAEEAYLRDKFAQHFDAYASDVPRWMPRLRGIEATFAAARFRWRRVVVKEYGTPFGWICGICLLGLWHLWRSDALAAHAIAVNVFVSGIAVTTMLWMFVLVLKKGRVLVAD